MDIRVLIISSFTVSVDSVYLKYWDFAKSPPNSGRLVEGPGGSPRVPGPKNGIPRREAIAQNQK